MKYLGKHAIFLLVSIFILMLDVIFVSVNYWQDRTNLQQALQAEGERLHSAFEIAEKMTLSNMSQLATFVANNSDVRDIFSKAVYAIKEENKAYDSDHVNQLRQELYGIVSPSWKKMTQEYYVRQLHFHIGPGSTSFLRVHKAGKFGDNMDDLRHIIVDVNEDGIPRTGFELGRVYSGLRGVVPVFDTNMQQIGALEAGTSYKATIQLLSNLLGTNIAILLKENRVEQATWSRPEEALKAACDCFVEATSSDSLEYLLNTNIDFGANNDLKLRSQLVKTEAGTFAVIHIGIRDYIGQRDDHSKPVGRLFLWYPADELLRNLESNTWLNIKIATFGFILVEVLLFVAIRLSQNHLKREVVLRTEEVEALNKKLTLQATTDPLTGLYNRRYFTEHFERLFEQAAKNSAQLSAIILDLDYFKKVNDTYGHTIGDEVLIKTGHYLKSISEKGAIVARYGGEEFCILLPDYNEESAKAFAERLCVGFKQAVTIDSKNGSQPVTCSVGVCERQYADSADQLLSLADAALYAAKQQGRNRVVLYTRNKTVIC
ncbi:diguanylate cyclase (GGDEF) domain-containing protein [Oceanospirillum multiglobuliferum]|uniref:diguanylate cyclase n=1 Tax=Oceanospirillum multiglobuliferum TaxID=64969 RepID=A0A1T4M241_9GAMM|nr:diguanylate cyclase [Oceanospirillum multiglobuliferum]OPX56272.1 hypothetical protein BTE48_04670 [Oceanospirillum multiglobuliferum]SJZ61060.1 diguanylate cyclase (GGDEF) domain-containing protein [Oceanospirillum multiglobuliferum]